MQPMHEKRSYGAGPPLYATRVRDLEFLAHWHSDVELLYVESGSILASVNRDARLLGPGSLVACGSRDIHYYERGGQVSETILVIFKCELLGHAPLWPSCGHLADNFASEGELAACAGRVMRDIVSEMKARDRGYEAIVRGGAIELCGRIERELGPERGHGTVRAPEGQFPEPAGDFPSLERMQRAIDYIYERSAYPISLADAAEAASLSPSYFSRVFARTVGANFRAFVNGIRIERAEELMADSPATLADIALECGFESLRTFNRAFRALRGATPSEARRDRDE